MGTMETELRERPIFWQLLLSGPDCFILYHSKGLSQSNVFVLLNNRLSDQITYLWNTFPVATYFTKSRPTWRCMTLYGIQIWISQVCTFSLWTYFTKSRPTWRCMTLYGIQIWISQVCTFSLWTYFTKSQPTWRCMTLYGIQIPSWIFQVCTFSLWFWSILFIITTINSNFKIFLNYNL